ncbi:hypothetical protein JCM24511_08567 [Saitozyma sp. JCM 24511]|nr:hypothetical protein JCM24511_08567 [Saitozyma sp. JCM 24511]
MLCRSSLRHRAALAIATPHLTSPGIGFCPQQRRAASRGAGPSEPLVRAGIFGKQPVKEPVSDSSRRPDGDRKGTKSAGTAAEQSVQTRRGRSSPTLGASSPSSKGGPVASVLQGKRKGRDGTSGAARPRSAPRSRLSEPPVPIPDLSALPHLSNARRVVFARLDFETAVPAIYSKRLPIFHCPFFSLRACPANQLPPHPASPFPTALTPARGRGRDMDLDNNVPLVRFAVISSKAAVSNLAVERNRARTRFKAAVDLVVRRGVGLQRGVDPMDHLLPGRVYLAAIFAAAYDAPMEQLCGKVVDGFKFLNHRAEKAR